MALMIEHHIQRDILNRLMHAVSLRFSELKPDGMESNIFMYHLKQLITAGYVQKSADGYHLATLGLTYVDSLSSRNHRPRQQPKLVAMLALRDSTGKWLLAERKVQPYIGTLMFPSGKQHRGETGAEHATRELAEKTGLHDVSLHFRGTADIQTDDQKDTLLTHVVARVYEGMLTSSELPPETDRFRYIWYDFAAQTDALMPGTFEIYRCFQQAELFDITLHV